MRIGGGRFLNQLRSPQSSSDSPLEQAGSNRQYRVRRPRFRERGSCRLSLPQRRRRRDETRYHDDGGGLPRDQWFESGFLQQTVCLSPAAPFKGREPGFPRGFGQLACRPGQQRLAGCFDIASTGGNISVGRYSSTAVRLVVAPGLTRGRSLDL